MQLIYDKENNKVWMFATPNELLEIATAAHQRVTEGRLGESLTVFNMEIGKSDLTLTISADERGYKRDRPISNT